MGLHGKALTIQLHRKVVHQVLPISHPFLYVAATFPEGDWAQVLLSLAESDGRQRFLLPFDPKSSHLSTHCGPGTLGLAVRTFLSFSCGVTRFHIGLLLSSGLTPVASSVL